MKIRVLYEENIKSRHKFYTTIEIPDDDYSILLDIDYEQRLAEAKPDKKAEIKRCENVQQMFDHLSDKEYNNWRRFYRHLGEPKTPYRNDEDDEDKKDLMDTIADDSQEAERNLQYEYDDWCGRIRRSLKPEYAEMIIAIHLDGLSVQEYADLIWDKPNNVSHRLKRAEKNFREIFPKTSFSASSQGYQIGGKPSKSKNGR